MNNQEIKNLKKAAKRILKAINPPKGKQKERIILYGDADLDGVTSVIILEETIKNLGGEISAVYFPEDRETEGYGISVKGLEFLKKFSPALLISLDLGISNFKEAKMAKKMGFNLIIIDHHEILDKLPEAEIIVDPKQKNDKSCFEYLANVGITFKLSEILLGEKNTQGLRQNFLELTALATLADMMPQIGDNIIFINDGLKTLENSWRPGIRAFFETDFFENGISNGVYTNGIFPNNTEKKSWTNQVNLENNLVNLEKVFKIISALNVRDVENNLPASYRLLNISSSDEAEKLVAKLKEKNLLRKKRIKEIVEDIERRIVFKQELFIFEGDTEWEAYSISAVASILCNKYKKPVFLFKKLDKESQGTVRSTNDKNCVSLMKKCKKWLMSFGGHPKAAGFRIKNENIQKFKDCLIENF
jgi:single-stranded-DNA-specific exonuclease